MVYKKTNSVCPSYDMIIQRVRLLKEIIDKKKKSWKCWEWESKLLAGGLQTIVLRVWTEFVLRNHGLKSVVQTWIIYLINLKICLVSLLGITLGWL